MNLLNKNEQELMFLRSHIPSFKCKPGCHDCCGPVTTSSEEMAKLPVKSEEEHTKALNDYSCPHLSDKGCQVYHERPLICRLFGTTPQLACPNDCRPEQMIDPNIEQRIYEFNARTRQVLV